MGNNSTFFIYKSTIEYIKRFVPIMKVFQNRSLNNREAFQLCDIIFHVIFNIFNVL